MMGLMNQQTVTEVATESDPLVDEVRQIRRKICEAAGHDLDRLVEDLRRVERDYAARAGDFAGITADAANKLVASWGDMNGPGDDPLLDEIHAIRATSKSTHAE